MHTDLTLEAFRGFFSLENYLDALRQPIDKEKVEQFGHVLYREEHELAAALFALQCKRADLPHPSIDLNQKASGAIPLYRRGGYPWGALPYPRDHAELGKALYLLGEEEMARKCGSWQSQTLDHRGKPIPSLFQQEGQCSYAQLEESYRQLYETLQQKPSLDEIVMDQDFGLLGRRGSTNTILSVASGCKSGMGVFLGEDAAIVNYGPQLLPLGDCSGFGLAGVPQELHLNEECLSYRNRIAAPNPRKTGLSYLQDSGFSGFWVEVSQRISGHTITTELQIVGSPSLEQVGLAFFAKADSCIIAKTHKLSPRSLDRYRGPAQSISFGSSITLELLEGASSMEVIPLAGDDSFWGADFLLGVTLASPKIKFTLS